MNYNKTKYGYSQSLMDYNKILKIIGLQEEIETDRQNLNKQ